MTKNLINQGRTAEVLDIGNNQVLKLFRKSFPFQAIENELNVANAIKDYDLPIPKFFGKVEQEGRIGLVYENIRGLSMLRLMMLKPLAFFSYAKQMAEIHSIIHKTKVSDIPQQKEQLEFFINRNNELPKDTKEKIINKLRKLNSGNFLCHGDLHPDNILYSVENNPVIIDWMTATAGNPAGDVARTKVILKYSKAPSYLPLMTRVVLNKLKSILCNTYIKHYIKITGTTRKEINEWELPVAAARLFENGPKEEKEALIKFINKELKNKLI
jgi:aminoglycoside phosphotransferase (APT) family kinase protein